MLIKRLSGFSIVEALLAGAVFVLLVSGLATGLMYGQQSMVNAGQRERATLLAQEGLEAARNIRDKGFAQLVAGTYGVGINSGSWSFLGNSDMVDNKYTRTVQVQSLDGAKEVISTVTWQQSPQRIGTVALHERLSSWNQHTWQMTTLSDFGLGRRSSVDFASVNDGAIKLSLAGDWTKSRVQTTYDIPGNGQATGAVVVDGLLYTTSRNTAGTEFNVFDISNISGGQIQRIGGIEYGFDLLGITTDGVYAFLITSDDAKQVIALRLADLSEESLATVFAGTDPSGVAWSQGKLAVSFSVFSGKSLYVLDASNPVAGLPQIASASAGRAIGLAAQNGYAFAVGGNILTVVRLADGQVINNRVIFPGTSSQMLLNVAVQAKEIFVTRVTTNQPEVYRVLMETNEEGILTIKASQQLVGNARAVVAPGDGRIYVATSEVRGELVVLDASTLSILGTPLDIPGNALGAFAIAHEGSFIYLATNTPSNEIVVARGAVGGWEQPQQVSSIDITNVADANAVAVDAQYLYVGTNNNSGGPEFYIYQLTDLLNPVLRGTIDLPGTNVNKITIAGNYAYLATSAFNKQLIVVDISDKVNPIVRGSFSNGTSNIAGTSVAVLGSRLYLGTLANPNISSPAKINPELYILDITNPALPSKLGSLDIEDTIYSLVVRGDNLFIGSATTRWTNPVTIWDVSVPANIVRVASLLGANSNYTGYDLLLNGNTLYLSMDGTVSSAYDVLAFDVTRTDQPVLLGSLYLKTKNRALALLGTHLLVASDLAAKSVTVVDASSPASLRIEGIYSGNSLNPDIAVAQGYAYIANNSDSKEIQIIGPAVAPTELVHSGFYTSNAFDSGNAGSVWNSFSWVNSGNGMLKMRLRTSPDGTTWSAWQGPAGTSDYYTVSGQALNPQAIDGSQDQWLQVRAYMDGDSSTTPILESMQIDY